MRNTAIGTNGEGRFIAIGHAFREHSCHVSRSNRDMMRRFRANKLCIEFSYAMDRIVSTIPPHHAYDTRSRSVAKCVRRGGMPHPRAMLYSAREYARRRSGFSRRWQKGNE